MSKITRATQLIFGSSAGTNQISEFGSLAAGGFVAATTPAGVQALSQYLSGWFSATVGSSSPCIEDMNGLCYLFAYQLAYLMQAGVPEWDSATTYYKGSVVNSNGTLYYSLIDTNLNNAVGTTADWKLLIPDSSYSMWNGTLTTSVASNALTIAVKTKEGNDPTAQEPVYVAFRNATSATGTYTIVQITSALSIVVPSATTIGTQNGTNAWIYVYLLNNSGTAEIAVSLSLFDEGSVQTTTAVSGGSSNTTIYSTTARTSVPIRVAGRVKVNEATAGTWASAPTEVSNPPFGKSYNPSLVYLTSGNGYGSTNTVIRRFSATVSNYGNDITYADSATLGATFTINTDGIYAINYMDSTSGASDTLGISVNSSQLTTGIGSITSANILMLNETVAGDKGITSYTGPFRAGDVVRAHNNSSPGVNGSVANNSRFVITRVGNIMS